MGISVTVVVSKQAIIKDEKEAKKILLNMPQKSYRWVDSYDSDNTLAEILECWRYETEETKEGLKIVGFSGSNLGEDDKLWWNLKSIVTDLKISFVREDGFTNIIEIKDGEYTEDTI